LINEVFVRTGFLKYTIKVLISYLIIAAIIGYAHGMQASAADVKEMKVTSPGGYTNLHSKSQSKGSAKVIVKVHAPVAPESLLQEKDVPEQRAATLRMQDQVIAEIESKGHKPRSVHRYKYSPYMAMTVDSAALNALLSSPDVVSVEEDIPIPLALDWSIPLIGANQLHSGSITGEGIAVAILDSGVDKTHSFLEGSVISEACYSTNDPAGGSSSLCPEGATESTAEGSAMPYGGICPAGECDHGTHVAGIVAGRRGILGSPGPGVAPEAGIIAIQVFSMIDSGLASWSSDLMKGLERVLDLHNTSLISPTVIASVNMSLGGGAYIDPCDNEFPALRDIIISLRKAGIASVIASGNDYSCGAISYPACISLAVSVGATNDLDAVASYSNSAYFLSLLAPGTGIISSIPGGNGSSYKTLSGTSMATPHVAGAWALMKQENPAATVDDILNAFASTGRSLTDQGCTSVTKQRINVEEAYNLMSNNAQLTVVKRGVGTGIVTSDPPGMDCSDTCSAWFARDTSVKLDATADPGSEFGGWSGGECSGTGSCIVALLTSASVNALFLKQVTIGTEITITGTGFGTKKGKVLISDVTAKIAEGGWTDDAITCVVNKVPKGSPGIFDIMVIPEMNSASPIPFENALVFKKPEIDSLSDNHGVATASILINGRFFGTKKPKVYLESADKNGHARARKCRVSSWKMDSNTGVSTVTFRVPLSLKPKDYQLKVVNKVGTASTSFTIDP
jgi:subtilisin family serine protease